MEPEGVPEPRLSWILCRRCHQLLQIEIQSSPVTSPLRLRIAMGLVASEYWPQAYPTRMRAYISDRRWIIFIAAGFMVGNWQSHASTVVWSVGVWILYGGIIALSRGHRLSPRRVAWLSVAAFSVALITLSGITFVTESGGH